MFRLGVIVIIILIFFGCGPYPTKRIFPIPTVQTLSINIKTTPDINVVRKINIGDIIAESIESASIAENLVLLDNLETKMNFGGSIYPMIKQAGTVFPLFRLPGYNYLCGCKDQSADSAGLAAPPADACVVDMNNDGIIDATMFKRTEYFYPLSEPVRYKIEPTDSKNNSGKSFVRRLIFNGYSGGVLRIGYREFYEGTARPAFNEEYSLNISKSGATKITIRSVELTVEPKGPSGLKYTAHKGFDHSGWAPE